MHACDGTRRGRRLLLPAAVLLACALGSVPAAAQLPIGPEITVPPLPLTGGEDDSNPPPTTTTTAPPPTTTTTAAPAPSTGTTATPSSSTASPAGSATTEPARALPASRPRRGSSAEDPTAVATLQAVPAAEQGPTLTRLRRLTLPTARQFGFPLGLALLVLGFVVVQGRLDARDPKLAFAPVSVDDDLLPFT